jgi:hypothetical protein
MLMPAPVPPRGLRQQIVRKALADRRRRQRPRFWVAAALAASVVVALLIARNRLANQRPVPEEPAVARVPIDQSVREAREALASIVNRTKDEALNQGRVLLPKPLPDMPMVSAGWGNSWTGPIGSLRETGHGLSTTLEPVVSSADRAVHLFLRDQKQ